MAKKNDILSRINWELFIKHPIVVAFLDEKDEEEFTKDLDLYSKGDEHFQGIIGQNSLSNAEISKIITYIKSVTSRRAFMKAAAVFATTTVARINTGDSDLLNQNSISSRNYNGMLPVKGIGYDVGTRYATDFVTNKDISYELMKKNLYEIKNSLKCNAVRIYGEDINKLVECSKIALSYGLQVWFSPRLIDGTKESTLKYIINNAIEAEKLRRIADIVFVIGNEFTIDTKGFVSGNTYMDRGKNLGSHAINRIRSFFGLRSYQDDLNQFLKEAVKLTRQHFKGKITYAAGFWERVDWTIFDVVGYNYYLNSYNKGSYASDLREFKKFNKPVAILEFGCGSYREAYDKGGSSYDIINWNAKPLPELNGRYTKDENVQAKYIVDLLNIFSREGIYAVFVHTFVETHYWADDNEPHHDLDTASFNVIKVYPKWHPRDYLKGHIIPKKSFYAISNFYSTH